MHRGSEYSTHYIAMQRIEVTPIDDPGPILDIGGGGENIIGQVMRERAVVIDRSREELEEAPSGGLKIIMDAGNLNFLDGTFPVATAFFSLMYMPRSDHGKAFKEIRRVLKRGGKLFIWELTIPSQPENAEDIYMMPIEIELGEKTVKTGYGILWKDKNQDLSYFMNLAGETGFEIIKTESFDRIFYLELRKIQAD